MTTPKLIHINDIDSTNQYFKNSENKTSRINGTAILSDHQTKGKGQIGNTWDSEHGKNILMSVYFKPQHIKVENAFSISMLTSIAIQGFFKKNAIHCKIKWPNDILHEGKKICGILIENTFMGNLIHDSIIGMGLNVNQTNFPDFLPNATSMKAATKNNFTVSELADELHRLIFNSLTKQEVLPFRKLKEEYTNRLLHYQKWSLYTNGKNEFEGRILDISPMGLLSVEKRHGKIQEYAFKEISFLKF